MEVPLLLALQKESIGRSTTDQHLAIFKRFFNNILIGESVPKGRSCAAFGPWKKAWVAGGGKEQEADLFLDKQVKRMVHSNQRRRLFQGEAKKRKMATNETAED